MPPSLESEVKAGAETPQPDLADQQLIERHREIQLGLARSNRAAVVALVVSVGLAMAAVFYGFVAEEHASRARQAHQKRTEELWNAQLAQARALRLSGKVGRRQESLRAINQAAGLRPAPELRDEAIATLALMDIQPGSLWQPVSPGVNCYGMSPRLTYYGLGYLDGRVQVLAASNGQSVLEFLPTNQAVFSVNFSPDERFVAAQSDAGALEVWDVAGRSRVFSAAYPQRAPSSHSVGFHPGSARLAVACGDNTVRVVELAAGREELVLRTGGRPWTVRFDPKGERLAVGVGRAVHLFAYPAGQRLTEWDATDGVGVVEWHPDGNVLAAGSPIGRLVLLDVRTGRLKVLAGHTQRVIGLTFHPDGRLLVSASWDGTSRFWDARSGRLLLVTQGGYALGFDPSGQRLGFFHEGKGVGDWQVEMDRVYQTTALPLGAPREVLGLDISQDGRWLAATARESVHLYERRTGRELDSFPWVRSWGLGFTTDGQALVLSSDDGLYRAPLQAGAETNCWRLGTPELLAGAPPGGYGHPCIAFGDRRRFGVEGLPNIVVVDMDSVRVAGKVPVTHWHNAAAPSPDGHLLATSRWKGGGTEILNLASGQRVAALADEGGVTLFSPDGRWLVVGTAVEFLFYDTQSWRLAKRIRRESASAIPGFMAFSPDSRLLAVAHTLRQVRLLAPDTGATLASLDAPSPERITALSFSGDGALLAVGTDNSEIQLWDLRELRQRLRSMQLDWNERASATTASASGRRKVAGDGVPPAEGPGLFYRRHAMILAGAGAALALVFALSSLRHHRRLLEAYVAVEQVAAQRREALMGAQTQLLHSYKMRALGTLAAGIAHDFNNLLSVIRMSSQLVARQVKATGASKENLEAIEHAVAQGKEIVRSILGYSRKPADPAAAYSVTGAVSETLAMLSKPYLGGIVLTLELDRDTPLVRGDRTRLEQVLLNLILNAVEAMQGAGKLLIRVQPETVAGQGVLQARPAPRYVRVRVSDTGPGIPPEVLPRIFEPFFTTKQASAERGTGLGMTTAFTIAQQDGWGLAVATAPGAGSTFELWLPAQEVP